MSLLIGNNLVVSMHYTLTDDEGSVIDTSDGREPLAYLHGAGNIIPGLEQALTGKVQGDSLKVTVAPADGYGEIVPELIQQVSLSAFQGVDTVEPGMTFQAQTPEGAVQEVTVKAVEGDVVTIDVNHPLAGMSLNFDVSIISVREATEEEISHGHVH